MLVDAREAARLTGYRTERRFRSAVSRGVMPGPLDARDVGEALIAQQLAREWTDRRESWCGQ